MREWAGPIIIALVAAGAVAVWPESTSTPCLSDCIAQPFGQNGTLVIRAQPGPTGPGTFCAASCGPIDWRTPRVGLLPNQPVTSPVAFDFVNLTVYVFEEQGELVASNAPDVGGYRLYGDYVEIADTQWAQRDVGRAIERLDISLDFDVEVGRILSFEVTSHEHDWLVGPLYVTLRVDAIA
jgi:hypothetical protein